jgi:hypothetical protein
MPRLVALHPLQDFKLGEGMTAHFGGELAHRLKLAFGTAPHEPTDAQLERIVDGISRILEKGREPTLQDWQVLVFKYCPSAGKAVYGGIDHTDLKMLHQLAAQRIKG